MDIRDRFPNPQPVDQYFGDWGFASISDVAKGLGSSRNVVYAAINDGQLPVRYAGRRALIARDDLVAWLNSLPSVSPSAKGESQKNE